AGPGTPRRVRVPCSTARAKGSLSSSRSEGGMAALAWVPGAAGAAGAGAGAVAGARPALQAAASASETAGRKTETDRKAERRRSIRLSGDQPEAARVRTTGGPREFPGPRRASRAPGHPEARKGMIILPSEGRARKGAPRAGAAPAGRGAPPRWAADRPGRGRAPRAAARRAAGEWRGPLRGALAAARQAGASAVAGPPGCGRRARPGLAPRTAPAR